MRLNDLAKEIGGECSGNAAVRVTPLRKVGVRFLATEEVECLSTAVVSGGEVISRS